MVIDEHYLDHVAPSLTGAMVGSGRTNSTSVPVPGSACTVAEPPARSIRPMIDSAMPRRSTPVCPGQFQDSDRGVVVVKHIARGCLPKKLFISGNDLRCEGIDHLPLR
jgi:hypothetical protein